MSKHTTGPISVTHIEEDDEGCARLIVNTNIKHTDADRTETLATTLEAAPDLLAACKAVVRLSKTAPTHDRWQVVIGDRVESGHDSRQNARKRIDEIRRSAIARAEGGEG